MPIPIAHPQPPARDPAREIGGVAADTILMSLPDLREVDAGLERIVAAALSALSADHRDVLMQTYYAGRTVAEAAATWVTCLFWCR